MSLFLQSLLRKVIALALVCTFPISMWAQEAPAAATQSTASPQSSLPAAPASHPRNEILDYSKPKSWVPNPINPYTRREVASPDFTNSPRLDQLMRDGKIYLSMDDAVALALENNLDVAIQRYNLDIADTDILRANAGGATLGINSGIVQNTQGGGVGGLSGIVGSGSGGTSVAAGGAGAGALGLVTSTFGTGPTITSFDPVITGTLQMDRAYSQSTSIFSPIPEVNQNTGTANFSYLQGFKTGTNFLVGFNNTHTTTNNPTATFTPLVSSGLQFRVTQHLLQGFGFTPNSRFIHIAKNDREISDVAFRLQIITTVDQIENLYWNLVFAFEDVRVANESLAFAQKTLSDNKKQVEIGSLAPIEVVRAQSTVAEDQRQLTVAQTNLQLQELLMKNALSRSLVDPKLAAADVIPTSTMQLPAQEPVTPTQDLVNEALSHRAELVEQRITLSNQEISMKAVRNSLLPSLDLFAYYGGTGIGGDISQTTLGLPACPPPPQVSFNCFGPSKLAPAFRSSNAQGFVTSVGYNETLHQLVNSTSPDKGVGVTVNIPIRNRVAQATQVRSELEYRQTQMRLQQIENQVRIEVLNAQFQVTQNRAAVEAAQAAVDLARQSLDAEQKKYALGASTSTLVLQNQSALASAESNLVSAMATYEKAQVELDRATGLLLEHAGIVMSDAEKGEVTHMPKIPFVGQRTDAPSVTPPAPQ